MRNHLDKVMKYQDIEVPLTNLLFHKTPKTSKILTRSPAEAPMIAPAISELNNEWYKV